MNEKIYRLRPVHDSAKNCVGIPVVFLARQIPAPFEQQNSFTRRGQMVSEGSSTRSRSYDDGVVMSFRSHILLYEHRRQRYRNQTQHKEYEHQREQMLHRTVRALKFLPHKHAPDGGNHCIALTERE